MTIVRNREHYKMEEYEQLTEGGFAHASPCRCKLKMNK
jgi:hypothetical protein